MGYQYWPCFHLQDDRLNLKKLSNLLEKAKELIDGVEKRTLEDA